MHILHIYKDYHPVVGGIENHLRDLSEGLAARCHQVTVLVTNLTNTTVIERPQPNLTIIKTARQFHAASTPLSAAMLHVARGLRPDIVHLHVPYPPGDLVTLALPNCPPLVVTYHSDVVRQRALLLGYRPLLEHTLRRAARIIVTSPNYVASSPFLRRHAERCVIVPLGIRAERFAHSATRPPASSQVPTLLFVGRLRYYKGLHVLLDAMPGVAARLLIAGTGPEQVHLQAQAARLAIADRVQFLGDVTDADLPALYRAADVFVLPAHLRAEAFGIVLLEAMANGLPCVSTELGTGTSFVNQHGQTGFVVPPGDAAALARALNVLAANPNLRRHFGAAGQRRVQELFTTERMVAAVEQVYAEGRRKTEDG